MTTASDPDPAPAPTPDSARRNRRLGLAIGALVLAQVVGFIILFSRYGLPKDPDIWQEQQAREAQQATKETHE